MDIKKVFTIERFVHVLLFCFAVASTGTISEFLMSNKHNFLTSWGLAVALGFGLVAVSMMLASTSMDDTDTFRGMLAGVTVVAVMSAVVQTMAYHTHTGNWFVACVLGVGFPLIECVLAFGVALHDAAEKRKRILYVRDNIQQRISESVGAAMSDIDITQVRGHIEQRVDGIIRQQVDAVVDSMGLAQTHTHTDTQTHTQLPAQLSPRTDTQTHTQLPAQVVADTPAQEQTQVVANSVCDARLDDIDRAIIGAVRDGNYTAYAISKVVPVSATTLKRKKPGSEEYTGRIPALVDAGMLRNGSGENGNEYRLPEGNE